MIEILFSLTILIWKKIKQNKHLLLDRILLFDAESKDLTIPKKEILIFFICKLEKLILSEFRGPGKCIQNFKAYNELI